MTEGKPFKLHEISPKPQTAYFLRAFNQPLK